MNKSLKNKLLALSLTTAITLISAAPGFGDESTGFSYGSQIVDATESNNVAAVQSLLAQGANPNDLGEFDTTPLMRAAYHGNNEMVAVLLKSGAKPDLKDIGGASALTVAARENYTDVVKSLIKAGANPNLATNEGLTPLAIAKSKNNTEIANLLADKGANSGEQQLAQIENMPISKTKKLSHAKPAELADADINIDMSNGRLGKSTDSLPTLTAKAEPAAGNVQNTDLSLASFQLVDKVEAVKKPEIAASVAQVTTDKAPVNQVADSDWLKNVLRNTNGNSAYQLSDNQVISNSQQNSILNLGTFKSQEFAQNKITDLKSNFTSVLNGVELKVVGKAMGPATSYQVIGGILPNNKAADICSKLTSAGANCRVESSTFGSQAAFSQYTGTTAAPVPTPTAANKYVEKQDVLGPAKSPDVSSQQLPSIADAAKPQPTQQAKPSLIANNTTTTTTTKTVAPSNVGSFAQTDNSQTAAPAMTQTVTKTTTTAMPIPLPPASAEVAPAGTSQTSSSNFDMVNNMINSRNNDSSAPMAAPKTVSQPPAAVQTVTPTSATQAVPSPAPNIAATGPSVVAPMPMPISRSAHVQPVVTTPNSLVPVPNAPALTAQAPTQAAPTMVNHVTTSNTNSVPVAPLASASADVAPAKTTSSASQLSLPANYTPTPTIVVHSDKKPRAMPQNYAAAPTTITPKAAAPAPAFTRPQQANKFEVSRPVKVTDSWAPNYADETPYQAPLNNYSNREIWVNVDYFVNENAARYYIDSLKQQDPSLNNYRTRATMPLRGGKASAQIGPFDSDEAAAAICQKVDAQNQGYHCQPSEIFAASHNFNAGSGGSRHSSIYGSTPPMGMERHSSGY